MGWLLENGRKRQELTGKKDKKKDVNWHKQKKNRMGTGKCDKEKRQGEKK